MDEIYDPKEDSNLLLKLIGKFNCKNSLEIGAGSGFISKNIVANKKTVSDINKNAINHLKLSFKNVIYSDLFGNINLKYDTIIFNPPYLPFDKNEPKEIRKFTTGGKKGYEILVKFIEQSSDYLVDDGSVFIVFSSLTNKEKIDEVILKSLFEVVDQKSENLFFEVLYAYQLKKSKLLIELNNKGISKIKKLTRGKRGLIYTGHYNDKKVAIKIKRPDIIVNTISNEVEFLKKLNKLGIGPKLLFSSNNYFVYEFVEGVFPKNYDKDIKPIIVEVLKQCNVLDKLGINKEEMTNPYKHILIGNKVVLIDFERAHYTLKPSNVTQFLQYISFNLNLFDKDKILKLAKKYKLDLNLEPILKYILK